LKTAGQNNSNSHRTITTSYGHPVMSVRYRFGGLSTRSAIIIGFAIVVGLIHQAHNHSLDPYQPDARNLLGLQSTALGLAAVGISMTLNVLVVAGVLSMLWDRVQHADT
jgi:hypothetical protein